jgi:hypothetical protein
MTAKWSEQPKYSSTSERKKASEVETKWGIVQPREDKYCRIAFLRNQRSEVQRWVLVWVQGNGRVV